MSKNLQLLEALPRRSVFWGFRGGSSPKILEGALPNQPLPSSPSPFYPFSETEQIRTPYRPTFFHLAFESGGKK